MAAENSQYNGRSLLEEAVVSQPKAKHSATVVFLHGLGDTGNGWCYILNDMQLPHVKIVCPTASVMPVTINNGHVMPSWYDIYSIESFGKADEEGLMAAVKRIHQLLDCEQEKSGIPSTRFILGGMSQGGALAMLAALTYTKPLAGIISLSARLYLHDKLPQLMSPANKETPFIQCHGKLDHLVSYQTAVQISELIKTFNKSSHEFKSYDDLGHSMTPEEIDDLKAWIGKILPLQDGGSV